ncbi:MAG TPA: Hsp20/alpha crystallin family protein [Bryobacteraceae bacterium]|jgi:HSP20 family protein|nr:Hsp20/alpha crystallin family protein [Bryobacteraceae bacterium]
MSLIRYTPFHELDAFPANLRVFQDTVNRLFAEPNGRPWVPPVDIKETENELIFKADVPDVDMKDIDVRMENGTLTIRGERKFEAAKDDGGWHRVERSYGTFERMFSVPETVNAEAVKADYKNGALTITLPKKEVAKPRQIKVEVNH